MAEALGIASGIIAVLDMTFKVGGAGIKLRRRIHDVKEAREMLLDKLGQVQDIEEFLHHAESQIATNPLPRAAWSDPFLQRCIFRARAVLLELQQMIDRLLDEATVGGKCKRTLGSAKAVLQKDGIEALDARLMRALELFKLAQAQYTIALMTSAQILNVDKLPDTSRKDDSNSLRIPSTISCDSADENSLRTVTHLADVRPADVIVSHMPTNFGRLRLAFGSNDTFQFSLRTPDWLSSSVYSVLAFKSASGWQLNLRSHVVIIEFDYEIYQIFQNDHPVCLSKFLDKRQLSPLVRDMFGLDLIEMACFYLSPNIATWLLKNGLGDSCLESNRPDISDSWVYGKLILGCHGDSSLHPKAKEIIRMFASHGYDDDELMPSERILMTLPDFAGDLKILMGERCYLFSIEGRLKHVRLSKQAIEPENFDILLPEATHRPDKLLQESRKESVCSLMHSVAFQMSHHRQLRDCCSLPAVEHKWFDKIRLYASLDPKGLNYLDDTWGEAFNRGRQTPLSTLVNAILDPNHWGRIFTPSHSILPHAVHLWLAALSAAGIDLLKYGREEKRLIRQGQVGYIRRCYYDSAWNKPISKRKLGRKYGRHRYSLIGLTYGADPEHWKVWWAFEYEDYAGDFWSMIEDPVIVIPGSWVEDIEPAWKLEPARLEGWLEEQSPPLILSEYRKIRPPSNP